MPCYLLYCFVYVVSCALDDKYINNVFKHQWPFVFLVKLPQCHGVSDIVVVVEQLFQLHCWFLITTHTHKKKKTIQGS